MSDALHLDPVQLLAHRRWVLALVRRLERDAHLSEDAVQESYVAALEHGAAAPRRWWARVATNALNQRRRGDARRRAREERVAREREALPGADVTAARLEAQRRVVAAVLALDEPHRETIALHFYEGMSCAEIARRLALPAPTVRSRLSRALAKLRARLEDEGRDRGGVAALLPLLAPRRRVAWETAIGAAAGVLIALGLAFLVLEGSRSFEGTIAAQRFDGLGLTAPVSPAAEADPAPAAAAAPTQEPWLVRARLIGIEPDDAHAVRLVAGGAGSDDRTVELERQENWVWTADVSELVADVDDWSGSLLLRVISDRYMPASTRVAPNAYVGRPGAVPRTVELVVHPRLGVVRGRLTPPTGVPADGLQVALFASTSDGARPARGAIAAARSDADGRYELPFDRVGDLWLVAWRQGTHDQGGLVPVFGRLTAEAGDELELNRVWSEPGATVVGRVSFLPGSASVPHSVQALRAGTLEHLGHGLHWSHDAEEVHLTSARARTAADGTFELTGLEAAEHELRWEGAAQGLYERSIDYRDPLEGGPSVRVRAPTDDAGIRVERRVVEVRVECAGEPVTDARVAIELPGARYTTRVAADGSFVLHEEQAGCPYITVVAPGFEVSARTLEVLPLRTSSKTIELVPLADPRAGRLSVSLEGDAVPPRLAWSLVPLDLDPTLRNLGHRSGLVAVVDGKVETGAHPPGRYQLVLNARAIAWETVPYYLPRVAEVVLTPGEETSFATGFELGGRLTFPDPAPEGARWSDHMTSELFDAAGEPVPHFWTDAQLGGAVGRFVPNGRLLSHDPLPPGDYELRYRIRGEGSERTATGTVARGRTSSLRVE